MEKVMCDNCHRRTPKGVHGNLRLCRECHIEMIERDMIHLSEDLKRQKRLMMIENLGRKRR
jgi:hypothetical protein